MNKKQSEQEARATLLEMLKPGDTVYTILRSVSRSGMSREIGLVVIPSNDPSPRLLFPNWAAGTLLDRRLNKHGDGIKVHGCGMDMGFELVYSLSRALGIKLEHRWL